MLNQEVRKKNKKSEEGFESEWKEKRLTVKKEKESEGWWLVSVDPIICLVLVGIQISSFILISSSPRFFISIFLTTEANAMHVGSRSLRGARIGCGCNWTSNARKGQTWASSSTIPFESCCMYWIGVMHKNQGVHLFSHVDFFILFPTLSLPSNNAPSCFVISHSVRCSFIECIVIYFKFTI